MCAGACDYQKQPVPAVRHLKIEQRDQSTHHRSDQLEIKNHDQRVLLAGKAAHQHVGYARHGGGDQAEAQVQPRNPLIEAFQCCNAHKRKPEKQPLNGAHFFFQKKYRKQCRENGRGVADGHCRCQWHVLDAQEEKIERRGARKPPANEQQCVRALPRDLDVPQPERTEKNGKNAAEEHDFHGRQALHALDSGIHDGKENHCPEHVDDALGQ